MFANETDNTPCYCETLMISSHFSRNPNILGNWISLVIGYHWVKSTCKLTKETNYFKMSLTISYHFSKKNKHISGELPCSWFNSIKINKTFLGITGLFQNVCKLNMFTNEMDKTPCYCETVMISSNFSRNPDISGQLTCKCFNTINITHFYVSLYYYKMLLTSFPDIM